MILNSQAVLAELIKYQRIVDLCKMTLNGLSAQQMDDLRGNLKVKLDECEFTRITGLVTPTVPLHSVTNYIDKPDVLLRQISEAEAFIEMVIIKIKEDAGPFYSKSEVKGFKEGIEKTLEGHVWGPTLEEIKVKIYTDPTTGVSVQADWTHGQYRTAKDGQEFGSWKFFTK